MFFVQQHQADQAQCCTTEAYLQLPQHGQRGTTIKAKSALHYFYLGTCRVLFLRVLAMLSECKISSDNITCPICYILFSYKPILMFSVNIGIILSLVPFIPFMKNLFQVRYVEVINNRIFRAG